MVPLRKCNFRENGEYIQFEPKPLIKPFENEDVPNEHRLKRFTLPFHFPQSNIYDLYRLYTYITSPICIIIMCCVTVYKYMYKKKRVVLCNARVCGRFCMESVLCVLLDVS